jgi:hypothetical protein
MKLAAWIFGILTALQLLAACAVLYAWGSGVHIPHHMGAAFYGSILITASLSFVCWVMRE